MDPRALATLRAVRAHGGVTPAAAVLHLTPSAVSQQLAALQRDVGVTLCRRVGRVLRLTPAGEALADAAVDVAVAIERARAACQSYLGEPGGLVSVSAFQTAAMLLLPPLLSRVAAVGGIRLECWDEDVAQHDFVTLTDRVDVVIAHRPDDSLDWTAGGAALHVVPLLREPLDVAVPAAHPLAARDRLRPADLVDAEWITVREGFPFAAVLAAVTAASGVPPRIVHRINDVRLVAAMVAGGHGISLLPRHTCGAADGLRLVPLAGVRSGRRIEALLRPDRAERLVVRRVLAELRALTAPLP